MKGLKIALGILLLAPGLVYAQEVVSFDLEVEPLEVEAGGKLTAILEAHIEMGWHLYSMTQPPGGPIPTSIQVPENAAFEPVGEVLQPAPRVAFDPNFGINAEYFDEKARFEVPVRVRLETPPGEHELPVRVRFMVCSDTTCLPPQTRTLTRTVTVTPARGGQGVGNEAPSGGGPAATRETRVAPPSELAPSAGGAPEIRAAPEASASVAASPPLPAVEPLGSGALPSGLIPYLWFAMTMGGLALLTPCVFPMIPITVSYFTKRNEGGRKRAALDAGLYSLGIILTFTLLGFLLTFLFGAGGINRLAASPWINLFIALVFILFALSLFGVVELRLPSSWVSAVDRKASTAGGMLGILFMALTFSLTSFTCTVPFVGTVMVAALHGDLGWSLLGVGAFATVFAAPFFFLALFPSFLQSLPKSGNWMNSVKITMGFLELAAALKFLSNVDLVYQWEILTRPVFITLWLAIGLVLTVYLLGWFRFPHESSSDAVGAGRVLSAVFFLAVSLYLLRGLFGFPLGELDAFLPPRDYGHVEEPQWGGTLQTSDEGQWIKDYQQALQVARRENRPILIDFTGYTCTNCRWMEANIFPLPEVQRLFQEYILVRLYTDGTEPEHEANQRFERERFGTIALPFYAVMSPQDEALATFPGLTRDRGEFIRFLESGLARHQQLSRLSSETAASRP